jgi:hypothetical protein
MNNKINLAKNRTVTIGIETGFEKGTTRGERRKNAEILYCQDGTTVIPYGTDCASHSHLERTTVRPCGTTVRPVL